MLKVKDIFQLKILKFLFKLYHNTLPPYFNNYRADLEKIETPHSLRPHPLPVPRVSHVYAEAGMVYKLVVMQNKIFELFLNFVLYIYFDGVRTHSYHPHPILLLLIIIILTCMLFRTFILIIYVIV